MSAALIVATDYLPIPAGTQSYTLKDDDVYYSLAGARSFSVIKQKVSIGRNYRNELPASYIGKKWFNIIIAGPSSLNATTVSWASDGEILLTNGTMTQTMDTITSKDDRFNATPPFDDERTVSFHIFWDGQTGSGNVVACCASTLFEQFSPAPPTHY